MKKNYNLIINGQPYEWPNKEIKGLELRKLGNINQDTTLYYKIEGKDAEVHDTESIDLGRVGVERFFSISNDPQYKFIINDELFTWNARFITGAQLLTLGNLNLEDNLFLKEEQEDLHILSDMRIDLAPLGKEEFYSKSKPVKIIIIVNGREKEWQERKISYEELVQLAFGNYDPNPSIAYTVTYDMGPSQNPNGSMVKGDKVFIKVKMVFNVTATDKS